jgi:hypothetical protein
MGKFQEMLNEGKELSISSYEMKDAYSFDRLGYVAGDAVLQACVDAGYTEKQAELIFRSKNTRWFYDQYDTEVKRLVIKLFGQYLKENKKHIDKELVKEKD